MIVETFEYDNNHGSITGSVHVGFYFNDTQKIIDVNFNNFSGTIIIVGATLCDNDFFPFTEADDWLDYEAQIQEHIEQLETPKEPEFTGYGYNGSDVQ